MTRMKSGRDGVTRMKSGRDGVTRMQSGVMISAKKSHVALLHSNTTKITSPTRDSRPDHAYMTSNTGGICKA